MISKIDILNHSADILQHEHEIITFTLPPLIADEYTVKGVTIPLISEPVHDTAELSEINNTIALLHLHASPELIQSRYTSLCLECREHKCDEEYQELISELCATFDEAYNLIWGDLDNEQ